MFLLVRKFFKPLKNAYLAKALLLILAAIFLSSSAYGAENSLMELLVSDQDPNGTNVRETPGGKIGRVISYYTNTDEEIEMRSVQLLRQREGKWFLVELKDRYVGWMHQSVLGTCASGTEDGDPPIFSQPIDSQSYLIAKVNDGTPLNFIEVKGNWVKVSYDYYTGKKMTGWMMKHTVNSNPYNDCWK
jgi:SH3-like domain-containing protein